MIILAIADRPPRQSILEILDKHPIELICTLGDLDYFSLQEIKKVNNIPKIGVYGNHCSGKYFESLGITNMHLKTFECGGLIFGGFEGSVRYKQSEYAKMYTQEEATNLLNNFPAVDVIIAHSPPYGINDEPSDPTHQGLIALKEYIETKKPKYLLHGHTYPDKNDYTPKYIETNIIYVYQDKIIKLQS